MKVLPINTLGYYSNHRQTQPQQNSSNVHFNGLSKLLSQKTFADGQKEIEAMLAKKRSATSSKFVGELPHYVINKIALADRSKAIPEIMSAFQSVAKAIRGYTVSDAAQRPDFANDILTNIFRKHGVLSNKESINLKYLGTGPNSKTFVLEGIQDPKNEDQYLLKVYHQLYNPKWHAAKRNGLHAELNNAMYWRAHAGLETQKGKFFFGDLDSGFMLTKYLHNDVKAPKKVVDPYKYGIVYDERTPQNILLNIHDSTVNGYNYRYSGMAVVNKVKNSDKEARYFMEQVKRSGYTIVNKKLKQMSPEKLASMGLEKQGKKLVIVDKKLFAEANLIENNGEIRHINNQKRLEYWKDQMAAAKKSESKIAGLAMGIKHLPANSRVECLQECLQYNMPKVDQGLAYLLKYLPTEESMKYFDVLMRRGNSDTQTILLNEIPLLSKRKHTGIKVADDINVSPADVVAERVEKYYELAMKSVNNDAVEHLASFIKLLPESSKYKYYKLLHNIDVPAMHERLDWNKESVPMHVKVRMLKDGLIDEYALGETYEHLRLAGMSQEQALRILGFTQK